MLWYFTCSFASNFPTSPTVKVLNSSRWISKLDYLNKELQHFKVQELTIILIFQ